MYEEDEDDEDWYEVEQVESDELFTVPCPHCKAEIYEDTPRCPVCGEYVTHTGGRVWDSKPLWYVALAILGILAVIATCLLAF